MKRGYDDGFETQEGEKKTRTGSDFRFLIEKRQTGLLIGKGGSKIQAVREESGVVASIIKIRQGAESAPERVLAIQGTVEQTAIAWKLFAKSIAEFQQEQSQTGSEDLPSVAVKILLDKSRVGCVIGKGGATIKQTQADTGVRIQVSNEPLPGSSEKTVMLTGTPEELEHGLRAVLDQIVNFPMRSGASVIPFAPGGAVFPPPSPHGHMQDPYNPYGVSRDNYSSAPAGAYGYGAPPLPPAGGPRHTQKIIIPSVCAGGVIGKGGSKIRDIQSQSGCTVRIADATSTNPNERVVTVEGADEGITIAIQLIRHAVDTSAPVPVAPSAGVY